MDERKDEPDFIDSGMGSVNLRKEDSRSGAPLPKSSFITGPKSPDPGSVSVDLIKMNADEAELGVKTPRRFGLSLAQARNLSLAGEMVDISGGLIKSKTQALGILVGIGLSAATLSFFISLTSLQMPKHPPAGLAGNAPDNPLYRSDPPAPGSDYKPPTP